MTMRSLMLDVSPLREAPQYRLLWSGQAVAIIGVQITRVAVPYQAYQLTHSSAVVGLVSLGQLIPHLLCSLVGGAIADAVDRRRLMMACQVALLGVAVVLGLVATLDAPPLWPLFVLTAVGAAFAAVDSPTRSASVASLVSREQFTAAAALNQTLLQVGLIAGPTLGGIVIATLGLHVAYWINAVTFAVSILLIRRMRPMPPRHEVARPGVRSILEGFAYLRDRQAVRGTFLADLAAMVFGMPRALFPAIAAGQLGGGAITLGLLHAAPAVGALIGTLTSGWTARVTRHGRAIVFAVMAWGAGIAVFGLSRAVVIAFAALVFAGAADVVSAILRQTVLQLSVPDRLRGRLSSVHIAVVQGGPLVGDARAGLVATATSPVFALVSGGIACIAVMGVIGWRLPALWRWTLADAVDDELPVEERLP